MEARAGKEHRTFSRFRVCSAMRPLLGSPIRTTVRSATWGSAAAGIADTAAVEAAARGARERALTAGEERRPTRKLAWGAGDWDRERPVNCAANIAGIFGRAVVLLPLFGGVRLAAGVFGGDGAGEVNSSREYAAHEHEVFLGSSARGPILGRSRTNMVRLEAQN